MYPIIGEKLNDIVPCEWTKIYPYAEVLDDSTMVLFHFKTSEKHQLIYSQDIPAQYNVTKDIFKTLLGIEHKYNNDQIWPNLT